MIKKLYRLIWSEFFACLCVFGFYGTLNVVFNFNSMVNYHFSIMAMQVCMFAEYTPVPRSKYIILVHCMLRGPWCFLQQARIYFQSNYPRFKLKLHVTRKTFESYNLKKFQVPSAHNFLTKGVTISWVEIPCWEISRVTIAQCYNSTAVRIPQLQFCKITIPQYNCNCDCNINA